MNWILAMMIQVIIGLRLFETMRVPFRCENRTKLNQENENLFEKLMKRWNKSQIMFWLLMIISLILRFFKKWLAFYFRIQKLRFAFVGRTLLISYCSVCFNKNRSLTWFSLTSTCQRWTDLNLSERSEVCLKSEKSTATNALQSLRRKIFISTKTISSTLLMRSSRNQSKLSN